MPLVAKRLQIVLLWTTCCCAIAHGREANSVEELTTPDRIRPKGTWQEATVPDTLDLAERARLAVNALTGNMDPDNGCLVFQNFDFDARPPRASVPSGLQTKNHRALPMMRAMCGSDQNLDLECRILKLSPDGCPVFQWEAWSWRDPDPLWTTLFEKCARAFPYDVKLPEVENDYAGLSDGSHRWEQMWAMRETARMYHYAKDERALAALRRYVDFFMQPRLWEDDSALGYSAPEHGIWGGHWHANVGAIQGLLHAADALGDDNLLQVARGAYDQARRQGVVRLGWCPAWSLTRQSAYVDPSGGLQQVYETCGTADTLILAVKLIDAGCGDYWDDVECYARRLAEQQWVEEDAMLAAAGGDPQGDALIRRFIGGFGTGGVEGRVYQLNGCCTANGSLALYYAWHGITRFDGGVAGVNMFLSRASAWMDIESSLPYEGKVVLRNKASHAALVRVPGYLQPGEIECRVNGAAVDPARLERHLLLQNLAPGDEIVLTFPLADSRANFTIAGVQYEATFRGNCVIGLHRCTPETAHDNANPPSRRMPLYQAHVPRNDGTTPMKTARRFVADRVLPLQ